MLSFPNSSIAFETNLGKMVHCVQVGKYLNFMPEESNCF
jgi:hypothetical protein